MHCKFSDFWQNTDIEGGGKVGTGFSPYLVPTS